MPNGKLLAVCNDDSSNCLDLLISNNDRRILFLNLKKIAGLIADLTKDILVFKDLQAIIVYFQKVFKNQVDMNIEMIKKWR